MVNENIFLFDTYAIIEIINGNKDYEKYLDCKVVITDFIFAELCYSFLKDNLEKYESYLDEYAQFIVKINVDTIKEAMKFRFENKKRNLSMADRIGYVLAKKLNIKFLTGDKGFEKFTNVEFVK